VAHASSSKKHLAVVPAYPWFDLESKVGELRDIARILDRILDDGSKDEIHWLVLTLIDKVEDVSGHFGKVLDEETRRRREAEAAEEPAA
jgi:hypothetical protein